MERKKGFKRKSTVGIIFLGVVFIGIVIGISFSILNSEKLITGKPINFTFETIDNDSINLTTHRGKVIVLYFHFLTCSFCAITTPLLAEIENDYSNSSLYIITISTYLGDTNGELKNWRSNYDANWELVRDNIDYDYSSYWDVAHTPTAIVIDKNGIQTIKLIGSTNFDDTIRAEIETHL